MPAFGRLFFMAMPFVEGFESRVLAGLTACGVDLSAPMSLAAAVSGGADSISLVTALSHILPSSCRLSAVTVNHNLREESETAGDADFAGSYCASLGVDCVRYDIPRGQIAARVRQEGLSLEEAARDARYACFERFMAERSVDFLALAHNRNDQLETLLMRFLAGGGVESLAGIRPRRSRYLRPLLGISRADIERYLGEQGIAYRTDSTNADNGMLRNRIRNVLVPVLDGQFGGWGTALLSLSAKMRDDGELVAGLLEEAKGRCAFVREGPCVRMDAAGFRREARAVRVRLLFAAADAAGLGGRIPYSFFARIADRAGDGPWAESCAGVAVTLDGDSLRVGREEGGPSERGFCVVVREEGVYEAGGLAVSVFRAAPAAGGAVLEAGGDSLRLPALSFPFLLRSRQPGDQVAAGDGSMRSVASVLDGWKCAGMKDAVPLVQRLDLPSQPIAAVWGGPLGFKNWVVKY